MGDLRRARREPPDAALARQTYWVLAELAAEHVESPVTLASSAPVVASRGDGELRKINGDQIAALALKSSPARQWEEPFVQLGNSKVEASFADHRRRCRFDSALAVECHRLRDRLGVRFVALHVRRRILSTENAQQDRGHGRFVVVEAAVRLRV